MNDSHTTPNDTHALIEARDIKKTYQLGRVDVPVLHDASLAVRRGEWVAILGASGSGKSTLLHIMATLDHPDSDGGIIRYKGKIVSDLKRGKMNEYRNRTIGFVFQFYHLLPELTVLENALLGRLIPQGIGKATLPLLFGVLGAIVGACAGGMIGPEILPAADVLTKGRYIILMITWGVLGAAIGVILFQFLVHVYLQKKYVHNNEASERIRTILDDFGLSERLNHRPSQLSGGERQRTAIARALANDPEVLLADEPTGNLDANTGREILDLLKTRHQAGLTIVMVTHDATVAKYADRVVQLEDGRVVDTP